MYIKEIDVENLGPLEKANIKFSFNEDGSPKPLILVVRMVLVNLH